MYKLTGALFALSLLSACTGVPGTSSSSTSTVIKSSSSAVKSSSSMVAVSSSSSSSSTGVFVASAQRGAQLFKDKNCTLCHGVDGLKNANGTDVITNLDPNRVTYRHSTDTVEMPLAKYISKWMPPTAVGSCDANCGADIAAFILTWRAPSDGIPNKPVSEFSCPTTTKYGYRTIRLLTQDQYQRSVTALVGYQENIRELLPSDFISGSFVNNNAALVDKTIYGSYLAVAETIAKATSSKWSQLLGCTPSATCADKLISDLAPRIFRRPLTTEEKNLYTPVAKGTKNSVDAAAGMEIALAAMLSSPQFIYRYELGDDTGGGVYKLTPYEVAAYLSFTFTGTTPSKDLLDAAGRGDLNTPDGIRQKAKALLDSAESKVLMGDLVNRWFDTNKLESAAKTNANGFADIAKDMKLELGKNFSSAMLNTSGRFMDLYNPGYTYINQRLANHYGISINGNTDTDGFAKVSTSNRGGILLSGAFLSRYAHADDANLITRAVALRRRMLCQDIPEPPAGVSQDREALAKKFEAFFKDPKTTKRMEFEKITSSGVCTKCHSEIINPLGGGLENFDTLGRSRTVGVKGNPIDATGTFFSPYPQLQFYDDPDRVIESPAITFKNGQELAAIVAENDVVSGRAQACLATQMVSYSTGIHSIFLIDSDRDVGTKRISKSEEDAYRCDISTLTDVLSGQSPRAMLEQLGTLDSVLYRKEWSR